MTQETTLPKGDHDSELTTSDGGSETHTLVDLTSSASLYAHAASLKSLELQGLKGNTSQPSPRFPLSRRVGTLLSATRTTLFVQAPLALRYDIVMSLHDNLGRNAQAETILKEHVLPACVEGLGAKHSLTLIARESLGCCVCRAGKYAEARDLWKEVWEARKEVLGSEDLATLRAQDNYGLALFNLGSLVEAEKMYREVAGAHEKAKGRSHWRTLQYRRQVAFSVHNQWRYAEAESLLKEILEEQDKARRRNHPDALLAKHCHILAIYNQGGDHKLAEESFTKLLKTQLKVQGKKYSSTLNTQLSVANAIAKQGRDKEADTMRREVLKMQEKVIGKDHPYTQKTRDLLII